MRWRRRRKTLVVAAVVTDELLRDVDDAVGLLDLLEQERSSRGFVPGEDIWLGYIVPRDNDEVREIWGP